MFLKNRRAEVEASTLSWILYLAIVVAAAAALWMFFGRV